MEKAKKYLNRAQQEALMVQAHIEVIIASRRFGKSFGIIAPRVIRNVMFMPGSTGAFVASTFRQAKLRTLPAMMLGLKEFGILRDLHYVVGKRPPKELGFKKPIVEPNAYEEVVSFWNGTVMVVLSQDVPMSANSMTLDWVICDEARGLDYEKLKSDVFPANGGTQRYFGHCPWHHSMVFVSDMPVGRDGSWLLSYREKMNPEMVDVILQLVAERYRLSAGEQKRYSTERISEIDSLLAYLRSKTVYYREFSIFENIDLIGVEYVKQLKRDLPPLEFQTSILCRRITTLQGGFYSNFRHRLHTYVANDNKRISKESWGTDIEYGCLLDSDVNLNQPISVAFDFNANINWLVAGQRSGSKLMVLKSFYVKYERKLREVVDDFCHYYHPHKTHNVVIYYDSTALGSNYAVNKDDFITVICEQFTKNGWMPSKIYIGPPMKHHEKHAILNDCLKGVKYLMPLLNRENNDALITSITTADVTITRKGFQKHKAGEKLKETGDNLLEYRTDGSDAFDTLVLGNVLHPYSNSSYMGAATT